MTQIAIHPQNFHENPKHYSMHPSKYSSEELTLHQKFVEYGRNAKEWLRKCAVLLPEIDRKKIWEKRGFGSIFEYAGKLAGMSKSSVEDALRILRKIEDKPALQRVVEKKVSTQYGQSQQSQQKNRQIFGLRKRVK